MKNIIVTGSSSGIGNALVHYFSDLEHNVIGISRNNDLVEFSKRSNVQLFNIDITSASAFAEVENYIKTSWNSTVDILINNAGQLVHSPFDETSLETFKTIYDANVFGVVNMIQQSLPYLSKDGHVVNVSSMGGVQGSMKFAGLSAYSSSKGAVITLTELLAEEYKESGPSFNVLALGAVQTKMLEKAFPDFQAPVTAKDMAAYIGNFALTGHQFYNGKLLQVSSTTP